MTDALQGFVTIGVVILAGVIAAQFGVIDDRGQRTIANVSFTIGSPALLLVMLADADLKTVFGPNLFVAFGSVVIMVVVAWLLCGLVWQMPRRDRVIAAMLSSYVNGGNLGLPIALYVLGDAALMAPVLLMQVVFLQPLGLTLLDLSRARRAGRRLGWWSTISRPVRNPMTVGTLLGLIVNLTGITLPMPILAPLELMGNLSVPCALLAFGIALRLGPKPGLGPQTPIVMTLVALKLIGQPLAAYGLAVLIGASPELTLAVCVIAALPAAQNVFIIAQRYDTATVIARDAGLWGTLGSIGSILLVTLLLG